MTVTENDAEYKRFAEQLFGLKKPKVQVGIFEADGQAPAGEGTTLIEVATWNEFGTTDIPARSFLRARARAGSCSRACAPHRARPLRTGAGASRA